MTKTSKLTRNNRALLGKLQPEEREKIASIAAKGQLEEAADLLLNCVYKRPLNQKAKFSVPVTNESSNSAKLQ